MISIKRTTILDECDNCGNKEDLNFVNTECSVIVLCDECLQELNRKIVEHLAEKNL